MLCVNNTKKLGTCLLTQWVKIEGKPILILYDTGASLNLIDGPVAEVNNFRCVDPKPAMVTVVGGKSVSTGYGTYELELGPDDVGRYHSIYSQGISQITIPLLRHDPTDFKQEVVKSLGSEDYLGKLPEYIGGGRIGLILGMRHPELLPTLVCTLPNGLGVYRSRFQDVTGSNLVFGGPYASPENVDHEEARTMLLQTYELMSQLPQPEEDLEDLFQQDCDKYAGMSMLDSPDIVNGEVILTQVPEEALCDEHRVADIDHICAKVSTAIKELGQMDIEKDPYVSYRCV